jgi:sporulation protein YlmC with PRC-barrel domain
MMSSKNIFGKDLIDAYTSDDILGKEVIDSEGSFLGVAEKIFIDKINMNFVGIAVDKGLVKKGFIVGKGYIERIAEHAIFLKTSIVLELRGLSVFDKNGEIVGKVNKIISQGNKNTIKELIVSNGFRKEISIPSENISTIGHNTIINKSITELTKN